MQTDELFKRLIDAFIAKDVAAVMDLFDDDADSRQRHVSALQTRHHR